MRLFKLVVTLVILGLLSLFVYYNMTTWTSTLEFKYKLPLFDEWVWRPALYLIMLLSALFGFFLGIAVIMKPYLKARRALAAERQEKKAAAPAVMEEEQAKAS
jgi:predicted small integral membrane protein